MTPKEMISLEDASIRLGLPLNILKGRLRRNKQYLTIINESRFVKKVIVDAVFEERKYRLDNYTSQTNEVSSQYA